MDTPKPDPKPAPTPEALIATLTREIETTLGGYTVVDAAESATLATMQLLYAGGWIKDGVPPVAQVLADGQQFAEELQLAKLVVRFFRVMILSGVVIPETPVIMDWLRDYIDGNLRVHGPLGKPMLWPGRVRAADQLLRDWGYQPTPTHPAYVSPRPGGPAKIAAPAFLDPQAPDRASVPVLAEGRAATMGALLDSFTQGVTCSALDRATVLRAMSAAFDKGATWADGGWIVGNGNGTHWRTWGVAGPEWTADRDAAIRYARRMDAEMVHGDDDDAWMVVPYAADSDHHTVTVRRADLEALMTSLDAIPGGMPAAVEDAASAVAGALETKR